MARKMSAELLADSKALKITFGCQNHLCNCTLFLHNPITSTRSGSLHCVLSSFSLRVVFVISTTNAQNSIYRNPVGSFGSMNCRQT